MNSEASIRRTLTKQGLRLNKYRGKNRELYGVGQMVIDDRNTVMLGATHWAYDATLNDVVEFVKAV